MQNSLQHFFPKSRAGIFVTQWPSAAPSHHSGVRTLFGPPPSQEGPLRSALTAAHRLRFPVHPVAGIPFPLKQGEGVESLDPLL